MTKIKTLKNWNENHTKRVPIAPRTHTKAVYDDDGNTLDSLMAVQDEKLSELGSKVGNNNSTFSVFVGSNHSSDNDRILLNIKKGEWFTIAYDYLDGASILGCTTFIGFTDGTAESITDVAEPSYNMVKAKNDVAWIGLYINGGNITSSGKMSITAQTKVAAAIYAKSYSLIFGDEKKLPNIDTNTGDMTMYGEIVCGNSYYPINGEVFNIKGSVKTSSIKIVFNTTTNKFRPLAYNTAIGEDDIIIGTVKTNYGDTYTNFVHAEFPFAYTLDGKDKLDEIDKKLHLIDATMYFANGTLPIFEVDSLGVVTITFPNVFMRLYKNDGGFIIYDSTNWANKKFVLDFPEDLIYNITTNDFEVISSSDERNYHSVLIFRNMKDSCEGALKPLWDKWIAEALNLKAEKVNNISNLRFVANLVGENNNYVSKTYSNIVVGDTYKIVPRVRKWDVATNDKNWPVFAFAAYPDDDENSWYAKSMIEPGSSEMEMLESQYIITPSSSNLTIGIRAVEGLEVSFDIYNNSLASEDANSIFSLFKESEFLPKIATLKKQTPYGYNRVNTPLSLMWFSDLHADLVNLDRINQWRNRYTEYVDGVLNCGDTVYDDFGDYGDSMNDYFNKYGGKNMFLVMGNHDVGTPNAGTYIWDGSLSITEMYQKYIAPMNINGLGLVQPNNAESYGYCFYYKDFVGLGIVSSGIRLIVVDVAITDTNYQAAQVDWLTSVLSDANSLGYSVVIASHYTPQQINRLETYKGFVGVDKTTTFNPNTSIPSSMLEAVDSFINDGGQFVTWLCGHEHGDYIGTVEGHSEQLAIAITSARQNGYHSSQVQPVRLRNTIANDAFNHIEIDSYYKRIIMLRVGYNFDALSRPIDMIVIDYENKMVIGG